LSGRFAEDDLKQDYTIRIFVGKLFCIATIRAKSEGTKYRLSHAS